MAVKRYISTDLPEQSWYMDLEPKYKSLWIHLLLSADIAGVFEVVPRLLSVYIGEPITERDIFTRFGSRVIKWKDKGLIPAFVRNQYYSRNCTRLSPNCKPHQYVLARLAELGLDEDKLDELASREPQLELPLEDPPKPKAKIVKDPQGEFVKPSIDEIKAYCESRKNDVDPEKFFAFYESTKDAAGNWYVGKRKMKDWKMAVITWEKRNKDAPRTFKKSPVKQFGVAEDPSYVKRGGF